MIKFRTVLQDKLKDELLPAWVGPTAGLEASAKTFDKRLYTVDYALLPFVVVNVRRGIKHEDEEEIGNPHGLYEYEVHIYYVDHDTDYDLGDARRDLLVGQLEKMIERNVRLGNCEAIDTDSREYVFDTDISSVTFDSSGQEEDYTFVTELYLRVFTARSTL